MTGDILGLTQRPIGEIPKAIELCVREKDRFPCLGVIYRLEPDGRIYCTRCGGKESGVVYARQTAQESAEGGPAGFRTT